MRTEVAALLLAIVHVLVGGAAVPPARPFDVAGARADRAVAVLDERAADAAEPRRLPTPMLARLAGVLSVMQGPEEVRALYACLGTPAPPAAVAGEGALRPVCTVVCQRGGESARTQILQRADGSIVARAVDPSGGTGALVQLRPDRFTELTAHWPEYPGSFDAPPADADLGNVFEVPKPYTPGRITMDSRTLGARFLGGRTTSIPAAARDLSKESFFLRVPRGYHPRTPAGLLVWVSPMPDGRTPAAFETALDELGLICIGAADSGNERPVADRYQLALDGVATASRLYHIDPRRVYVTGMSGAGRVSSMLLACFPDVFTGAVPIVGVSIYENIPAPPPNAGKHWPAGYQRPDAKRLALFRTRRMAAMTGPPDFNYPEITAAVRVLDRDGVQAKLFEYPDMAHQLPTPERFAEALRWVDQPYRELRTREVEKAQSLLDACARNAGTATIDAGRRRALEKVTEAGPWTPAAWEAARLLGATSPP